LSNGNPFPSLKLAVPLAGSAQSGTTSPSFFYIGFLFNVHMYYYLVLCSFFISFHFYSWRVMMCLGFGNIGKRFVTFGLVWVLVDQKSKF
jgi:hypothetical protein